MGCKVKNLKSVMTTDEEEVKKLKKRIDRKNNEIRELHDEIIRLNDVVSDMEPHDYQDEIHKKNRLINSSTEWLTILNERLQKVILKLRERGIEINTKEIGNIDLITTWARFIHELKQVEEEI